MQKRGQEMSISTLVLIVIAIIVLVIVVVGFTGGWQNLWDRITNLGGGSSNVGVIIQACKIACDTGTEFDYKTQLRNVVFDSSTEIMVTCKSLESAINGCYDRQDRLNTSAGTEPDACGNAEGHKWVSQNRVITDTCEKFA